MPLSPGSQVAGYKVISLLGSGGMGEVYLVENPHLLRREALKVISLAGAHDPDFQKRFTNEARTTASLDHPSIISIHQYGINDEGTPWFTMSYLDGRDLSSGPTSPADVVAVTAQVADALDYAHRHHVIHRDVKPANIIVSRDPSTGEVERVTVLDFGIAKLVNSTSLTATSAFIGTLAYCAPEVIEGHDATAMSDQYSLACTVFQLLTGQAPFTTTTPSALVMAHLTKPIPPISSLRPDLAAFDPVLHKGLAKNPADRYPNCRAFAAALKQALDTRPGPGPRTGPTAVTNPPSFGSGQQTRPPSQPTPAGFSPVGATVPGHPPVAPTPQPSYPGVGQPNPGIPYTSQPNPSAPFGAPPAATTPVTAGFAGGTPPPGYNPAQPNSLLGGGGYPSQPGTVPPKKKRTGLIIGAIAAALVVVVVAVVGIGFATGLFGGSDEPAAVVAQPNTVATSGNTTCAVTNEALHCWGNNANGQLGNGTSTDSTTPVAVSLTPVTSVSIGNYVSTDDKYVTTACAISDRQAYCWGANNYGQIGDGSTDSSETPKKVSTLSDVTAISTGFGSTCAISAGEVYCWGDNDQGQLGTGGTTDSTTPTKVTGVTGTATDVATARGTTCAIADGTVYCWGNNDSGQIGNGSTSRQASPVQLSLTDATDIAIGSYKHSETESTYPQTACAAAAGKAYCWGDNAYGQIGDGTTAARQTPTEVVGLTDVTDVATDWGTSCAVASAELRCWGDNSDKQLGDGSTSDSSAPKQVTLAGAVDAVSTNSGTTCARVDTTDVYCWGYNVAGQVGNGASGENNVVATPFRVNISTS
ncbi:protein kinase [Gordonia sp. VNQ95]|uniref:protein kinase domain-containing protein n=1 Tax=Gordonia TaxID=2053 RepID=UPI0032B3E8CB